MGKRVLVGLAGSMLALPCSFTQAQSAEPPSASRAPQRTPRSGTLVDGTPPYNSPETTSEGVLQEMASRASVIFTGTVTAVVRGSGEDPRSNAAASVVEVDFAVDHAVQGTTDGAVYAMREWAGLWRDSPRFAVGQRLLMLLHAPGPGGLSSPVDGLDGAIPIKTMAAAPSFASPFAAVAAIGTANTAQDAAQDDAVDMRWLQAKTLRVQRFADEPTATPGEGSPVGLSGSASLAPAVSVTPDAAAEPATAFGLTHVLGLLKAWRETGNVSH